jgi:hypothetical protein
MKTNIHFTISRLALLRMRYVSDKICRENQNTHIMFNNFIRKSRRLCNNVEKHSRDGKATDGITHAHFVLDKYE